MNRDSNGRPLRVAWYIVALLLALAATGCDRPCDRLQQRLEACTRHEPERSIHDAPGVRDKIRIRCRGAEPTRVKRCLALKSCKPFLRCAAEAVQAPSHHF